MEDRTVLYASTGPRLACYDVDVPGAVLSERCTLLLPAGVQYAWPHALRQFLYVGCSDGGPGRNGTSHFIVALRIGLAGELVFHGDPIPLESRPVHVCTDAASNHLLVVYNAPSSVSVFHIQIDGRIGARLKQSEIFRLGKTAHQILPFPSGKAVAVPVRGTDAGADHPEEPGSLEVFRYNNGRLSHRQSIAPNNGFGFGPRHVVFHPTRPWMYMSIERQNEIALFKVQQDELIGPLSRKSTLAQPSSPKPRQLAGAIHLHPNGRFAYVSNRADGTTRMDDREVFNGGENSIAVFALDPDSGEPLLRQHADTRGVHPRTFCLDASGRLLVAANMTTRKVLDGTTPVDVPRRLTLFRIGKDGELEFVRSYNAGMGDELLFWIGMVPPP